MNRATSRVSRRSLLVGAAGVLTAPMVIRASRAAGNSGSVTMVGWGGSFQDALTKYVMGPFTEETGIRVEFVPAPDMAKIKAMLLTGNVEWDVYQGEGTAACFGHTQGFWDKLDLSVLDVEDLIVPPTSDIVTWETYGSGITWNPQKYGPGKHPTDFAEFLDLQNVPGRRAFRSIPDGTLEAALLADGVAPNDIYPLDLDRAFKALGRAKGSVWAATTPQTVSLVQTGEVDFSYTFVNRVKGTIEPGGGVPLAFSLKQNLIFTDTLAVLKGAPNKQNAMTLLAYMLRPEVQARLQEQLGLMPVSKKALSMLSAAARKWLPDMNNPNNLIINNAYWADSYDSVSRRLKEWIMS